MTADHDDRTRLALIEHEIGQMNVRLNDGAKSFAEIRMSAAKAAIRALLSVIGMLITFGVAVGGVVYTVGRESAQRDFTAAQAEKTDALLTDTREELRLMKTRLEVADTMLKVEADRRAELEQAVRALALPRRPR